MKKRQLRLKEKVYTEKVPKQKKIHSKKAVKWIWCLVLFLCFSGGLAFFQSMKTKVQVSFLKDEIQQLQKKEVQSRSELTYTPEIESFMNRFVALYMNTFDNHEQEQQRQETLKKEFYAQNFIQEPGSVSGVRKLTAASFIGLKEIETIPTASYKVTYDIRSMNPESKKETSVTITQVLNLPFSISNKGCRIIAYPYFTALPKNTEKQRMITYDDTLYETVDASEAKDVEGFVEDFLDKYAKNNAKDMSYMMKEPEGLNQTAKVDQVEMKVLRYKETKKPFIVKATVVFRDGDTSLLQKEQMTIVITKKTNQYYVEKLTHNWLDRKGEERK